MTRDYEWETGQRRPDSLEGLGDNDPEGPYKIVGLFPNGASVQVEWFDGEIFMKISPTRTNVYECLHYDRLVGDAAVGVLLRTETHPEPYTGDESPY